MPETQAPVRGIEYLDLSQAEFREVGGFLHLRYRGEDKGRVILRRALPLREPFRYLSIADAEQQEIAILRDLAELDADQRVIVERELEKRYYCPEVRAVISVKDKMGYNYLDLLLEGGQRSIAVKDVTRNIRLSPDNRLFIVDVDGNRYVVNDVRKLDTASLRRLEPYMF